jgi:ferredoxin-type protein NapH
MKPLFRKYKLSVLTFIFTAYILSMVQCKVESPMILIERFIPYSGWFMIIVLAFYAAFLVSRMKDPRQTALWRKRSWTLFSIVFFGQLILGVSGLEKFLMNPDKLHFPIPALIVGGPVYRGEISFMPILFLSTVVLAGPAWCSQFCYFGAIDNIVASKGKPNKKPIAHKNTLKHTFLFLVVLAALIFNLFGIDIFTASIFAASFGIVGLLIIFIVSRKTHKMYHCTVYCPIGTVIRYIKYINPFRMYIDSNCSECLACTKTCYYDALNENDIKNRKPATTCTLCGDCVSSCHTSSIKYKFFRLKPENARNLWLVITIVIHAVFLCLARL